MNFQTNSSKFSSFKHVLQKFDLSLLPQGFQVPYNTPLMDEQKFNEVLQKLQSQDLENILPTDDVEFDFSQLPKEIVQRISKFNYLDYLSSRLRKQTNFFGFKLAPSKILSFQLQSIKTSLLQDVGVEAITMFNYIVVCMNVKRNDVVIYQFDQGIQHCEALYQIIQMTKGKTLLSDELYTQLIKQLLNNKDAKFVKRIYEMIQIFVALIRPCENMIMALLNYCITKFTDCFDDGEILQIKQIMPQLLRLLINKQGMHQSELLPLQNQIKHLRDQTQLNITISFCFGLSLVIHIQSHENITDLKRKVLLKLQIDEKLIPVEYFGIFQIRQQISCQLFQKLLPNEQNVWEQIVLQQMESQQFLVDQKSQLLFKIIFPYLSVPNDYFTRRLESSQFLFDIFVGYIRLESDDFTYLTELFNEFQEQDFAHIPNQQSQISKEYLQARSKYFLNKEQTNQKSVCVPTLIVELASKYEQRMGVWFQVDYKQQGKELYENVYLVLRPFKLCIVEQNVSQPLVVITFAQIVRWETEQGNFIQLRTDNDEVHIINSNGETIEQIKWHIKNQAVLIVANQIFKEKEVIKR